MFSTPTLAKIAVSAANIADSSAHICQEPDNEPDQEIGSGFMVVLAASPVDLEGRLIGTEPLRFVESDPGGSPIEAAAIPF